MVRYRALVLGENGVSVAYRQSSLCTAFIVVLNSQGFGIHLVKLTRQKAGLSDSQSVKTTGVKRQIVTDEIGCLLAVAIHKANLHDTKIGYWVAGLAAIVGLSFTRLTNILAYK